MDFRSFFKPAGTNPEIEGPYYELSSFAVIVGHSNFEALTLGFKKGSGITKMTFRPIDPTKPIVLAVDNMTDIGFVYIDHHLEEGAEAGMRNYRTHKTDDFLIDCQSRDTIGGGREYWSVTSEGMTFVFGEKTFPDTWHLRDADLLCAFVAGGLTANKLRMHAYLSERAAVKEKRCEDRICRLSNDVAHLRTAYDQQRSRASRNEFLANRLQNRIDSFLQSLENMYMQANWLERFLIRRVRDRAKFFLENVNEGL
jgi:hypothetical protein